MFQQLGNSKLDIGIPGHQDQHNISSLHHREDCTFTSLCLASLSGSGTSYAPVGTALVRQDKSVVAKFDVINGMMPAHYKQVSKDHRNCSIPIISISRTLIRSRLVESFPALARLRLGRRKTDVASSVLRTGRRRTSTILKVCWDLLAGVSVVATATCRLARRT